HTCSYILQKGRPGEECGKSAVNEQDGQWYCSSHVKKTATKKIKTTAKKAGQSPVDNKSVLKTIEDRELKLRKNSWGLLWDSETHITFRKNDEGGYTVTGQQDMNAKKGDKNPVIPLTGEQVGICQGWNLEIDE